MYTIITMRSQPNYFEVLCHCCSWFQCCCFCGPAFCYDHIIFSCGKWKLIWGSSRLLICCWCCCCCCCYESCFCNPACCYWSHCVIVSSVRCLWWAVGRVGWVTQSFSCPAQLLYWGCVVVGVVTIGNIAKKKGNLCKISEHLGDLGIHTVKITWGKWDR